MAAKICYIPAKSPQLLIILFLFLVPLPSVTLIHCHVGSSDLHSFLHFPENCATPTNTPGGSGAMIQLIFSKVCLHRKAFLPASQSHLTSPLPTSHTSGPSPSIQHGGIPWVLCKPRHEEGQCRLPKGRSVSPRMENPGSPGRSLGPLATITATQYS